MRHLLHFGLFALALMVVSQASADDDSDYERDARVIVVRAKGQHKARPVRATHDPPPPRFHEGPRVRYERDRAVYDSRRVYRHRGYELAAARANVLDQQKDYEQISRIANRWEQATANHNQHALFKIERRLDDWIEREIIESRQDPYDAPHVKRLQVIRRELEATESWFPRGHAYGARYGRGYGRGWRHNVAYKAQLIDELVELSERQVYRAQARLHQRTRFSFAYR